MKLSFFAASGLYSQWASYTSQNSKDKDSMHLWSCVPLKRQNHFPGKWIERTFYQVVSVWTGNLYTTSITGHKQPSTPLAEFWFSRCSSFLSVQAEALLGEFKLLFCSFTYAVPHWFSTPWQHKGSLTIEKEFSPDLGLAGKHKFCILEVSRETSKFWLCFQKMLNGWGERAESETQHLSSSSFYTKLSLGNALWLMTAQHRHCQKQDKHPYQHLANIPQMQLAHMSQRPVNISNITHKADREDLCKVWMKQGV